MIRATPVQVAREVQTAIAGGYHNLYHKTDDSLWTVGRNYRGQLGVGTRTPRGTSACFGLFAMFDPYNRTSVGGFA